MDQHQAVLKLTTGFRRRVLRVEHLVPGHQSATADPELRVSLLRAHPFDELHSWPNPAGILPPAAGAAQPLTQKSSRQHQASLTFLKLPRKRSGLAGGPHAQTDKRCEKVGRHRQT